jgi:uncharacterized membrane protein YuzA (DUF378 family)
MRPHDVLTLTTQFFVLLGALNYGIFGVSDIDILAFLLGPLVTIVYVLIGLSGLYISVLKITMRG